MKKPRIRVKRLIITIVFMVLIVVGIYQLVITYTGKKDEPKKVVVVNEITAYGYTLDKNEIKLYNDMFKSLKIALEKTPVDEEEYATLMSQMFVADFYNLSSKATNGDIGGLQFIHTDAKTSFMLNAQDTIYKYVESNIDGKRNQELPTITTISVSGTYAKSFKYAGKTDTKAYEVKVNWTYEKDLGYPTSATIILVHETDTKLAIVEIN